MVVSVPRAHVLHVDPARELIGARAELLFLLPGSVLISYGVPQGVRVCSRLHKVLVPLGGRLSSDLNLGDPSLLALKCVALHAGHRGSWIDDALLAKALLLALPIFDTLAG